MEDCLFCKIIAGDIPSTKVYENGYVVAFLDNTPINPGHTLVVPRAHARNLFDMKAEDWAHVTQAVHYLAPRIRDATSADGLNIGMNNEEVAGQSVLHPHVHIMPRFKNDGYEMWKGGEYKEGEAEEVAEKIKKLL